MTTRKKATGKTKAKRKRTHTKASTRKKTTTGRKTRPITKKTPRKASPPRKAKPIPAKPTSVRPTPTPRRPQPVPAEQRIGVVTHYYSHLSVAIVRLVSGTLHVGDMIHIRGHTTDFSQKVESIEVNHAPATEVGPNEDFGIKVVEHAREHDVVFKVRS